MKKGVPFYQRAHLDVPIFHVEVLLIAADDIETERAKHNEDFGEPPDNWTALCSRGEAGNFALFFKASAITHSMIAHEVLHLTLWILDYCQVRVTSKDDETAAYVCGYLTEWVYANIGSLVKK